VGRLSGVSALKRPRTLRGALCGGLAAAVWALAQPLDKRALKSSYDDIELLGRAITKRRRWYLAGLALHISNGAIFGAVYANVSPALPLPAIMRGPAAALAEHVALWPLGRVSDRLHPARDQLPKLTGNSRAFAQATFRHLLFGGVLGELERRLNARLDAAPQSFKVAYSSNGRGSIGDATPAHRNP
jgi:hypothetical protein